MVRPEIAICPVCGKRTCLRIQVGGYLREYPIRVHCMNCRALIKGTFIMGVPGFGGLHLVNASTEAPNIDEKALIVKNADYVAEISGELPCRKVCLNGPGFVGHTPFLNASEALESAKSVTELNKRLQVFTKNMEEWRKRKSIAFQLLEEGSLDYLAIALDNKMGVYSYVCDHYLKSLHCLQELVLDETKYLFYRPNQTDCITKIFEALTQIQHDEIHQFALRLGGITELVAAYRKMIEVVSQFMPLYPNLLPAETYMRYKKPDNSLGIATCSFTDIKGFYQDSYESIASLLHIVICMDNMIHRGSYVNFSSSIINLFSSYNLYNKLKKMTDDYERYLALDNGYKINYIDQAETFQGIIMLPADKVLRNAIGHNNVTYDGLTQIITAHDRQKSKTFSLMEMAIVCIGLVKSAILIAEIILFMLRIELRSDNIQSISHPWLYSGTGRNEKCPCGSNLKYKNCCMRDVENLETSKQ